MHNKFIESIFDEILVTVRDILTHSSNLRFEAVNFCAITSDLREFLCYHVALFAWSYAKPFWYNTGMWQTDREADVGHMTVANTALT